MEYEVLKKGCDGMERCSWSGKEGLLQTYHDEEWGIPVHDDRKHFEYLMMEVMQCGLNWNMMLVKREIFRQCFDSFDYNKIVLYDEAKIESILQTDGMIKSRRKVDAIIHNAKCYLKIIEEFGTFDAFIWSYTKNHTLIYKSHQKGHPVASNALSDSLSKDLKKRGFKYLGSITVYSHLQACGIINDHEPNCFMYEKVNALTTIKYAKDSLLFK